MKNARDYANYMKRHGFTFERETLHTRRYTDGITIIAHATRPSGDRRAMRAFKADVKRALRKREEMNPVREPEKRVAAVNKPLAVSFASLVKQSLASPVAKGKAGRTSVNRYDATTKELIHSQLSEFIAQGKDRKDIADALNAEGLTTSDGKAFTQKGVNSLIFSWKLHKPVKKAAKEKPLPKAAKPVQSVVVLAPVASPPEHHGSVRELVLKVLNDVALTDAKKIKVILAYLE